MFSFDLQRRRHALRALTAIVAVGALFRFYNLAWGAPFYHFHIDEHFVLGPADMMRRSIHDTAMSTKFFMYSPLLMYLINIVRSAYELVFHPLDLTVPKDQVTYMVLSRAISATFGTVTILLVYAIGARVAGRMAGVLSAFFLAFTVLHVRDSHFAATDISMTFFCVLALWCAVRIVEGADMRWLVASGVAVACAAVSKYTGAFTLGVVGIAYFLAPGRPTSVQPIAAWAKWVVRGFVPVVVFVVAFFVLDPLVLMYPAKFASDLKEWVTDPLTGVTKPIWVAQFANLTVPPQLYWFTNLLWWGVGPALEILGLAGVLWLFVRWNAKAAVVASFPVIYFIASGHISTPMVRYAVPFTPALALAAGIMSAEIIGRPAWRRPALVVVSLVMTMTFLYATAYMNVFRQPDSRIEASKWMVENVPEGSKVLVEPSQNTPPMGGYFTATNFHNDYVLWGDQGGGLRQAERERHDYYHLFTFDAYRYLYGDRYDVAEKRRYMASRMEKVDWIVMDDTYLQWYAALPEAENLVVRQHYEDLFAGKLGFALVKTFKVYPSLFGVTINDDASEFSFRLFDHPRVYIFRRYR